MRRFEASPRSATPKGQTFINCTAPPSPGPTYTTQPPAFVAHQLLQTGPMHRTPTDRRRLLHRLATPSSWSADSYAGPGASTAGTPDPAADPDLLAHSLSRRFDCWSSGCALRCRARRRPP